MIGQTIAHYRITQKLGAGGMGIVYRARDSRLERDVALKVLPPGAVADDSARLRLLQEARSASALNHPNVCTIYDVGEFENQVYIAMEYVEGSPLSALIPPDGFPPETVIRFGSQIADALAHSHEHGVIHRDLKSSNLMARPEGRIKILDFGLAARLKEEEAIETTRSQVSFAEQGIVVGTLHYLAPEVLRGEPAGIRSDIWALGVILHEMVAGELPFQGQTGFEVSAAILRQPPASLPAQLPAGLSGVILRCLAKDPIQRYQSAAEVRAVLETLQSEKPGTLRVRPSRKMLYKARSELRGKWKYLLTTGAILFAGMVAAVVIGGSIAGASFPRNPWKLFFLFAVLLFYAAAIVALGAFLVKRWTFCVYPNRIRAKSTWQTVDIPFDQIEGVELISYRKSWRSLFLSRVEFRMGANIRFKKLGEAAVLSFTGLRNIIKVECRGLGRRQGYYLDMDKADRFFETVNRTLGRFRSQRKSSTQHKAG